MKNFRQTFRQIQANPFHEDLDDLVYYAIKGECSRAYLRAFIRQLNIDITSEDINNTSKVLTDFTKDFYSRYSDRYTTTVVELYEIPGFKLPVLPLYQKFKEEFVSPGFVWKMAMHCRSPKILDDLLVYGRVNGEEILKTFKGSYFEGKMVQTILNRRPDLFSVKILEDAFNYLREDDIGLYNFLKSKVSADIAIRCLLKPLTREKRYIEMCMMDIESSSESVEPLEYWTELSEDIEEYKIRFELFKKLLKTVGILSEVFEFLVENDLAGMLAHFQETFPGIVYSREAMLTLAAKKECEHVVKLI
jgi:hypothetical protein